MPLLESVHKLPLCSRIRSKSPSEYQDTDEANILCEEEYTFLLCFGGIRHLELVDPGCIPFRQWSHLQWRFIESVRFCSTRVLLGSFLVGLHHQGAPLSKVHVTYDINSRIMQRHQYSNLGIHLARFADTLESLKLKVLPGTPIPGKLYTLQSLATLSRLKELELSAAFRVLLATVPDRLPEFYARIRAVLPGSLETISLDETYSIGMHPGWDLRYLKRLRPMYLCLVRGSERCLPRLHRVELTIHFVGLGYRGRNITEEDVRGLGTISREGGEGSEVQTVRCITAQAASRPSPGVLGASDTM